MCEFYIIFKEFLKYLYINLKFNLKNVIVLRLRYAKLFVHIFIYIL